MATSLESASISFVDAIKSRYGAVDDTSYASDAFLVGDSSRKRNKTWEMVGMEKTRLKQAQHSKLVHVVVRESGINVAQHTESEIDEQQLVRVQELDLSLNTQLTLPIIDVIVRKLPSLQILQVSDVPLFDRALDQAALSWDKLTKLVLNHTGFARLDQIASALQLPKLEELHLDNNGIEFLVEGHLPTVGWSLPLVHSLSLANNQLKSWQDSGLQSAIGHCFPSLKKLFLTGNALPDIRSADVPAIGDFMSRLNLLCLNDNKSITSPETLTMIRQLCPGLETFRITYSYLYPTLNESLARMLVVSSLPSIAMLNRAAVRQKERTDSELFYVQRGLSETDEAKKALWYPMTAELREKHKDVVLALVKDGETASTAGGAHVMLDLRFRCDGFEDCRKTVPSSLQIGKLKALLRTVFGVDPVHQVLGYWNGDAALATPPTPLDNELQSLAYFGVGSGSIILVRDASLR